MQEKMKLKILVAMIEPPLPFGGAASRWFYVLLHQLIKNGHEVKAIALCSSEKELQQAKEESSLQDLDLELFLFDQDRSFKKKLKSIIYPYSYMFSPQFLKRAHELMNDSSFDIIHLEQCWMGWLARGLDQVIVNKMLLNIHHLVAIDLEERKRHSWRDFYTYFQSLRAEKKIISLQKNLRLCSSRLQEQIKSWKLDEAKELRSIAVGLDSGLYDYAAASSRSTHALLGLVASYHWWPGRSAGLRLLERLWPAIKKQVQKAQLLLVGRGALELFGPGPWGESVHIESDVKEIRPYFEKLSLLLYAPERGSGMKIKILEAMLWGTPVITTSEGVEGLDLDDEFSPCIGNSDCELIEKAVAMLNSKDLQEKMRLKARQYVESYCSPKRTVGAIEEFYRDMINHKKGLI